MEYTNDQKVHDSSDPKRWNWKVKVGFESTSRRLSQNAGCTSNDRVCDAVDRDIWIMKNVHKHKGAEFLSDHRLNYESAGHVVSPIDCKSVAITAV